MDSPRGTKRKTIDSTEVHVQSHIEGEVPLGVSLQTPARIHPLSQDVVNKIAAGEIIVAPVHALKELLENAIDAGATRLEIVVKDGGLKLLQIADNGCGIHRDDLQLLCERFTTSKLQSFQDLMAIGTYGFRGEALASISHIAHLTVTTKASESSCAWRAQYSDGKLVAPKPNQSADPRPVAGRPGTQITVEDLFYNVPNRRRAFRSSSEEYAKILDLVGRYAIHVPTIAFSCKKHGESGMGLSLPANALVIDRIRQIHGSSAANELVACEASSERWGFKANGWISNANFSLKKTTFVLFINHRAVESPNIKKSLEHMYNAFLPKGGHPFVYISLDIEPHRLDVNVHPTKREVHFLHEDEIVETVCNEARLALSKVDSSRKFDIQTLLPEAHIIPSTSIDQPARIPVTPAHSSTRQFPASASRTPASRSSVILSRSRKNLRPNDNDLVRTDARERKITSMLTKTGNSHMVPGSDRGQSTASATDGEAYQVVAKELTICRLRSVKELRAEVREMMHNELTDVFATHTFVGIIDSARRIATIQSGVKLFLVDYGMIANEYFYQLGLTDFGNFGSIELSPPLNLEQLLWLGVEQEKTATDPSRSVDWNEVVELVKARLIERREMLEECFSLRISCSGEVQGLPLMMKGYTPPLSKLSNLLLRLGPFVNWEEEKPCFHSFLRELAAFYTPEGVALPVEVPSHIPESRGGDTIMTDDSFITTELEISEITARRDHVLKAIENVIFPAFRARLVATKGLLKGVVEVADLKGLYRIFERC